MKKEEKEKVNLTIDQISQDKLDSLLSKWNVYEHVQLLGNRYMKYQQHKLTYLQSNFIESAIKHFFIKTFPQQVEGYTTKMLIRKSSDLMSKYREIVCKEKSTNNNTNILLLLTVKAISRFYIDHSKDVEIKKTFEAQLFVSLNFILFNSQISQNCFGLIEKRYYSEPLPEINAKNDYPSSKLMIASQLSQYSHKTMKTKKQCKLQKKNSIRLPEGQNDTRTSFRSRNSLKKHKSSRPKHAQSQFKNERLSDFDKLAINQFKENLSKSLEVVKSTHVKKKKNVLHHLSSVCESNYMTPKPKHQSVYTYMDNLSRAMELATEKKTFRGKNIYLKVKDHRPFEAKFQKLTNNQTQASNALNDIDADEGLGKSREKAKQSYDYEYCRKLIDQVKSSEIEIDKYINYRRFFDNQASEDQDKQYEKFVKKVANERQELEEKILRKTQRLEAQFKSRKLIQQVRQIQPIRMEFQLKVEHAVKSQERNIFKKRKRNGDKKYMAERMKKIQEEKVEFEQKVIVREKTMADQRFQFKI